MSIGLKNIYLGTLALACQMSFTACESEEQPRAPTSRSEVEVEEKETSNKGSEFRLNIEPFASGAYPATSFSNDDNSYAIEFGYIDVREISGIDSENIFDYRWNRMGATSGKKVLANPYTEGCANVSSVTESVGDTSDNLNFSGAINANISVKNQYYKYSENEDFSADYDQSLVATFQLDDTDLKIVDLAAPPDQGAIQIIGPYTGTISTGLVIAELNDGLEKSEEVIQLADVGTGDNYSLIIVDFFGGSEAKWTQIRCFLPRYGTVSLAPDVYDNIFPVKAVTGVFANLTQVDGSWSSTIVGSGVEDISIP
jgi:hypothetical protein